MNFDRPPTIHGAYSPEVHAWLSDTWPTLSPKVVHDFIHWGPWSALFCGPQGTGKTLLSLAFTALDGGARYGHGREPGEGARRRLRVRDGKLPSLEFMLYGQRNMHAIPLHDGRGGSTEVPFVGYGRALATMNGEPPDAWCGLDPNLHILRAEGDVRLGQGDTRRWVWAEDGQPGLLVRHLAYHAWVGWRPSMT